MTKNKSKQERRKSKRIEFPFPVLISSSFVGETVNLSEAGVCIVINKLLESSRIVFVEIDLPYAGAKFTSHAHVIHQSTRLTDKRYDLGVKFLRPDPKALSTLKESLNMYKLLNSEFVRLTEELRAYLFHIKSVLDLSDTVNTNYAERIKVMEREKEGIFKSLDHHFRKAWRIFNQFTEEQGERHKQYYQSMLRFLILDISEYNRFVHQKPLGYMGDFMTINYHYDFQGQYFGSTSYEKIINAYSLNLFIAKSVVRRKDFFKAEIQKAIQRNDPCYILSVGSGPARELVELVQEGGIQSRVYFDCVDFEQDALDYVRNEINSMAPNKKAKLRLRLICKDLLEMVKKGGTLNNGDRQYNFIYSSGLFDYLSDRVAARLLESLDQLLMKKGKMIICNSGKNNTSERMHYEILSKWELIYRFEFDMIALTTQLTNIYQLKFERLPQKNAFLFMSYRKR